jgi:CBS domain containing-hemolysin-like protein
MNVLDTVFRLLAVIVLVLLNGFFVATEFSLVSVRRTRIDYLAAEGQSRAKVVQAALQSLDSYIAATQLGITMASLALGWIGEPALAHLIEPALGFLPDLLTPAAAHTVAVAIAFAIITTLHIVLGELAPKTIALQRPEGTALWVAGPTSVFLRIFWPFIAIMNGAGNLVVRAVGLKPASGHALVHSADELRLLVEESGDAGVLDEEEQEMLINVFAFANRPAYQAMLPRTEVVTIDHDASVREFLDRFTASGHTRFPVLGPGGVDDVVGIISAKDLLVMLSNGGFTLDQPITSLIRPAFFTPESKRIGDLLQELRDKHIRMAILIDEYGGMAGVVTMEDLIEDIVGDLDDELERDDQELTTIDERTSVVEGQIRLEDVNEQLGLQLPEGDYETLAGFVLEQLGRLPKSGDSLTYNGIRLTVLEMQGPRIKQIEITRV